MLRNNSQSETQEQQAGRLFPGAVSFVSNQLSSARRDTRPVEETGLGYKSKESAVVRMTSSRRVIAPQTVEATLFYNKSADNGVGIT